MPQDYKRNSKRDNRVLTLCKQRNGKFILLRLYARVRKALFHFT